MRYLGLLLALLLSGCASVEVKTPPTATTGQMGTTTPQATQENQPIQATVTQASTTTTLKAKNEMPAQAATPKATPAANATPQHKNASSIAKTSSQAINFEGFAVVGVAIFMALGWLNYNQWKASKTVDETPSWDAKDTKHPLILKYWMARAKLAGIFTTLPQAAIASIVAIATLRYCIAQKAPALLTTFLSLGMLGGVVTIVSVLVEFLFKSNWALLQRSQYFQQQLPQAPQEPKNETLPDAKAVAVGHSLCKQCLTGIRNGQEYYYFTAQAKPHRYCASCYKAQKKNNPQWQKQLANYEKAKQSYLVEVNKRKEELYVSTFGIEPKQK